MTSNPFSFANPMRDPARFLGRKEEIRHIVHRIRSSAHESTSIYGGRRMGKTSLLKYLSNPVNSTDLGLDPDSYLLVYTDWAALGDLTPYRFWYRILRKLVRLDPSTTTAELVKEIRARGDLDIFDLEDCFFELNEQGRTVVLFLDAFENITQSPNFDEDFFAGLRALAINYDLAIVTASRKRIPELIHENVSLDEGFFNIFAEMHLTPFSAEDTYEMLETYLRASEIPYKDLDKDFIAYIGGGHPFFLQMAGYYWVEGKYKGLEGNSLLGEVVGNFDDQSDSHFTNMWSHSSESEKITLLTVLSLNKQKPGENTIPTVENLAKIHSRAHIDVPELVKRGLLLENRIEGTYRLLSPSLERWIAREISAPPGEEESEASVDEWLESGGRDELESMGGILSRFKKKYWPVVSYMAMDLSVELIGALTWEILSKDGYRIAIPSQELFLRGELSTGVEYGMPKQIVEELGETEKISQGTVQWEKVHVFISSTFNDMHAERDFLVKSVFPELSEWCEARKLRLVDIDLRWGVTEQDATQNKNVVKVCLDRIDDCRPFFLCFLGQRRGWRPELEDISAETFAEFPGLCEYAGTDSVTEMEIRHALFEPLHRGHRSPKKPEDRYYHKADHAFFYLRDDSYLDQLPDDIPQLRRVFTNESIDDVSERMEADRQLNHWREVEIRQNSDRPVRDYQAAWDAAVQSPELAPMAEKENAKLTDGRLVEFRVKGDRSWISLDQVIIEDLKSAIAERFPLHMHIVQENDLQHELDQQEKFLFTSSEGFISRENDFSELDQYLESDSRKVFVLTAEAGMGKSTLLANWLDKHRQAAPDPASPLMHFRFVGQSDQSTTVYSLLFSILRELKEIHGRLEEEIPDDPQELRQEFINLLAAAGKNQEIVIVLDALNQLQTGLRDLNWLSWELPQNVKLVVSFKRGEEAAEKLIYELEDNDLAVLAEVRPFDKLSERRSLVNNYLEQYLKDLDEQHLEALINSPGANNPLFLKVILSELRIFGVFEDLGRKIREDFGDSPQSAFQAVLNRLETDPAYTPIDPAQAVPLLFGLLAHSRSGLSVAEVAAIMAEELALDDKQAVVDTIHHYLRQVRPFMARRDKRHDFFFESFLLAARDRYAGEKAEDSSVRKQFKDWHRSLARYFKQIADPDNDATWSGASARGLSELPYHLAYSAQHDELFSTLTDFNFLELKAKEVGVTLSIDSEGQVSTSHTGAALLLEDFNLAVEIFDRDQKFNRQNYILKSLSRALDFELQNLKKWPLLLWQQLYNRLQWETDEVKRLILPEYERRTAVGPGSWEWDPAWKKYRPWILNNTPIIGSDILIRSMSGHKATVTGCLFTADGRRILSSSSDNSLKFWDAETGEELATITGHTSPQYGGLGVGNISLSPDGSFFASQGGDDKLILWNADSGTIIAEIAGHSKSETWGRAIWDYAISPDSMRVVTAGDDKLLKIWNVHNGAELAVLKGHSDRVTDCVFSPDGKMVISASQDNSLRIWDSNSGQHIVTLAGHTNLVHKCAINPDGSLIASASEDGTIKIWNAESGDLVFSLDGHDAEVIRCLFSPDGGYLASAGNDQKIIVWDPANGHELATLEGHVDRITGIYISPDSNLIASTSADKTISIWELKSGNHLGELIGHTGLVSSACFNATSQLLVSASWDNTLKIWNLSALGEVSTEGGQEDGSIFIEDDFMATYSSYGNYIAVGNKDHSLRLLDATNGVELQRFTGHMSSLRDCVFTPDDKLIVTASSDRSLMVWNIETGERAATLKNHTSWITSCAVSPDGSLVLSSSEDKTLKIWDINTGEELMTLIGHTASIADCEFSPDGRNIASASWDKTVKIWDLAAGEEIHTLEGHQGFNVCTYSPDGKMLVSAGNDNVIRVWDTDSWKQIGALRGHENSIKSCRFSPDGNYLVSAGDDKTLRLWWLSEKQPFYSASSVMEDVSFGDQIAFSILPSSISTVSIEPSFDVIPRNFNWKILCSDSSSFSFDLETKKLFRERTVSTPFVITKPELLRQQLVAQRTLVGETSVDNQLACAVSPDSKRIASAGSYLKIIKIWDVGTGEVLDKLEGHQDAITALCFSDDNNTLVSASKDMSLKIWDLTQGQERLTLSGHQDAVNDCQLSPDGSWLLSASGDRSLKIWDMKTGEHQLTLVNHNGSVNGCAISPDGNLIASCSFDKTIKIWDLLALEERARYRDDKTLDLRLHPLDGCITIRNPDLFGGPEDDSIESLGFEEWNRRAMAASKRMREGGQPNEQKIYNYVNRVRFSPNGQLLVSANMNHTAEIYDVSKGTLLKTLEGHKAPVHDCAVSPDSELIVSADQDGYLIVCSMQNGEKLATIHAHTSAINACTFSPNGNFIVTASRDSSLKLWPTDGLCL
jgi:WD40 repeat protein/Cdc6-like AAA superfamily ATPase